LSSNPNITLNILKKTKNPLVPWNYSGLSSNPNITWEIVQADPKKRWNYKFLSSNPNITWSIVQANPDKPWDYCNLSKNPNITWSIVKANPDKPWNYNFLFLNQTNRYNWPSNIIKRWTVERINKIKEEMMQTVWHPDRFWRMWLSKGFDPDD